MMRSNSSSLLNKLRTTPTRLSNCTNYSKTPSPRAGRAGAFSDLNNSQGNISSKSSTPSPYKSGSFMINRTPDAKAKIMKLSNSAGTSEDGSSSRNSTITGTSCSESMGSSPALSSSSPSSLHTIQGYNTLDNSFMLNNSILELGESDSGSDGGENVSLKFGRYDSSDDEAETDLIKSMMKSSVSQRKPGVMNSKNAEANHKDDFLFSVDAQNIPINARNLPLLEQQSHESHDVLIHGSSTTSTNNESMTDPTASSSTISIGVEATDETVLTKERVASTATNQHLDEDHKYFYFDSSKSAERNPRF